MIELRRNVPTEEWQRNISASLARVGARVRAGEGFIYVAEVVDSDLLKVGFSLDPDDRIKQLRAAYGREFRLLGKIAASRKTELAFHRFLRGRAHGYREFYPRQFFKADAGTSEAA